MTLVKRCFKGKTGSVLRANELNWLQRVLKDNAGLFGSFEDREHNTLNKAMWHGEFPGKILTGMAQAYAISGDEKTLEIGNQMVKHLSAVQGDDGYLGPWSSLIRLDRDTSALESERIGKWDTWGIYHCVLGLYRWYKETGSEEALNTADKALKYIYSYFILGNHHFVDQKWAECNLAIGHAFALMYEEKGEESYLEAAQYIVNEEWNYSYWDYYQRKIITCGWMKKALNGVPFYASGQPRWEGIYALETLCVLYRVTKKDEYMKAASLLWQQMNKDDIHNTGSFGTGEGAVGDPYGEGSETCNTVAWSAFSIDYLDMSGDSKVADVLELGYFNAILGSLLGNMRDFTYYNLSDGKREPARIVLEGHSYTGARDMSCCQANGNRGLTSLVDWAVLTKEDRIYFNYYGESVFSFEKEDQGISVIQKTNYPADGSIEISFDMEAAAEFTVCLRIPQWSGNTRVFVNGKEHTNVKNGEYLCLKREWTKGDKIDLELDMTLRFWIDDRNDKEDMKSVSVYAGPLLLTQEPADESVFTLDDIKKAVRIDSEAYCAYMVKNSEGRDIKLLNYSDCGKNGESYRSWLKLKYYH